jgi:ribosomal protein S18 acetylase RimI-like enzyme
VTIAIRPFEARHLPAATQLLAANHRTHRARTPLLPSAFANDLEAMALVDLTWRSPGAAGWLALDDDTLVGFLIALRGRVDDATDHRVYLPASGYASRGPDVATITAQLFAALSRHPHADDGPEYHLQLARADPEASAAWRGLGFDDFLVLCAAPLPLSVPGAPPADLSIRQATSTDLASLRDLTRALHAYHAAPPINLPRPPATAAREAADHQQLLADPRTGCWLAFHDQQALGLLTLRPPGTAISPLHLPPGTIHIVDAITAPAARGRGVATALCAEALGWAQVIGYQHAALHVHAANEVARQFWEARGFTPIAQQLIRR